MRPSSISPSADQAEEAKDLPPRLELLRALFDNTGRGGVPLRSAFVQLKEPDDEGSRRGKLSAFTTDARALDAYLLIHALASAAAPYQASYPALTWAHAAGFDRDATSDSARQRWSKAVKKLADLDLIDTSRDGRRATYTLLHESGTRDPYVRPTSIDEGGWTSLPHAYWLDEWDMRLSLPEKLMLLVSLDQKSSFELPTARTQGWYGIPESTSSRGFRGLAKKEILSVRTRRIIDPHNATDRLWRTVNVYSPIGIWTKASRKKAMTRQRRSGRSSTVLISEEDA